MLHGNELKRGRTVDFFPWYFEYIATVIMFAVFPFPLLSLPGFLIAGIEGACFTIIALLIVGLVMGLFEYVLPREGK